MKNIKLFENFDVVDESIKDKLKASWDKLTRYYQTGGREAKIENGVDKTWTKNIGKFWGDNSEKWKDILKYVNNNDNLAEEFADLGMSKENIDAEMKGDDVEQGWTLICLYDQKDALDELKEKVSKFVADYNKQYWDDIENKKENA